MAERMNVLQARGIMQDKALAMLTRSHISALQHEGMADAAKQITKATGLDYAPLRPGEELQGTFQRIQTTPNAKYAVIERGHQFALVPWSQELERQRYRQIQIAMSPGMELSWTRGRSRGLGISM